MSINKCYLADVKNVKCDLTNVKNVKFYLANVKNVKFQMSVNVTMHLVQCLGSRLQRPFLGGVLANRWLLLHPWLKHPGFSSKRPHWQMSILTIVSPGSIQVLLPSPSPPLWSLKLPEDPLSKYVPRLNVYLTFISVLTPKHYLQPPLALSSKYLKMPSMNFLYTLGFFAKILTLQLVKTCKTCKNCCYILNDWKLNCSSSLRITKNTRKLTAH